LIEQHFCVAAFAIPAGSQGLDSLTSAEPHWTLETWDELDASYSLVFAALGAIFRIFHSARQTCLRIRCPPWTA
jgi:hypothetical protein